MSGSAAARNTDAFICPLPINPSPAPPPLHVGGSISAAGNHNVLINNLAAAVVGDSCGCPPDSNPPNKIAAGSTTVFFGNKAAARLMDTNAHAGSFISAGSPDVFIGG